jgi:TonB family protein
MDKTTKRFHAAILVAGLVTSSLSALAQAAVTPRERLDQLQEATNLTRDGIRPWHVRMSFQLYDIDGKPAEKGTVEVWYAGKTGERVVVDSPSLNAVWPSDHPPQVTRSSFLIDALLVSFERPMPSLNVPDISVMSEKYIFGKSTLDCLQAQRAGDPDPHAYVGYCAEPGSNILRLSLAWQSREERNGNGRFLGTEVALDHSIAFGEHVAISGHVDKLEVWDPERDPEQVSSAVSHSIVPALVASAHAIYKARPNWTHLSGQTIGSGSVVMGARIHKDGSVGDVIVIASPNIMLSGDAVNALKQWRFAPAPVDGRLEEVWTSITINFTGPQRN